MDDILNKPLTEITEDPFFRADNFESQPWYDDFQMYLHIGRLPAEAGTHASGAESVENHGLSHPHRRA